MTPEPKTLNHPLPIAKANPWLADFPLIDQNIPMLRASLCFALLAALFLSSCSQTPPGSDAEDERNPFFRQATKDIADLNYPAAIKQFEKAVTVNPNVAKAYLQIGLLYGDKLGDPISAIYFYQKYLEARPNAAEREDVLAAIEKAKIDFALSLNNTGIQNAAEIARISKENVDLKQQITQLQGTLAAKEAQISQVAGAATPPKTTPAMVPATPPAAEKVVPRAETASMPSVPAATPPPAPAEAAVPPAGAKQHTIAKGDTLWKLVKQYYPASLDFNEDVAKIKAANPGLDDRNLKIGTVIVIP
jgi:LysM repeat protein